MNFYDELANIFDEDKVTDDTHFKQLDKWDSITLMTLQQSLQSNFGVKLSLKDIMTAETIADLKSKCNMKQLGEVVCKLYLLPVQVQEQAEKLLLNCQKNTI